MSTLWMDALGCEVRYRGSAFQTRTIEAGSGEPLILIHGIGGHAEAYQRNVRRLGEHAHAIAVDLLWHGFSTKLPPPPTDGTIIAKYGEQIIDLLDSLGVEKATIEGESMGGWITLWLALNRPERLKKIILNTSAGMKWNPGSVQIDHAGGEAALRERSLTAVRNPNRDTVRKRLEWLMASPDRVTEELVDLRYAMYNDPPTQKALESVFETVIVADNPERITEADLAKITIPTLVIWSENNPGSGPEVGRRIANLIPGAQYYCIADAAHWPQWEKPEEHDRVVAAYMSGAALPQSTFVEPAAAVG